MSSIFDDMLNENRDMTSISNPYWLQEYLDHKQALISKSKNRHATAFSIERQYINSKAWHDKFEELPINNAVRESLYRQTGRLLEFINNLDEERQCEERLLAINARTGEFLVDNFGRDGDMHKTGFTTSEYEKVKACPDSIILVHNHSLNGPPSGPDLLSYLHMEQVKISIVACHDGNIYAIYAVKPEFEKAYADTCEEYKPRARNQSEMQRLAMTRLYQINEDAPPKYKLFDVRKL